VCGAVMSPALALQARCGVNVPQGLTHLWHWHVHSSVAPCDACDVVMSDVSLTSQ